MSRISRRELIGTAAAAAAGLPSTIPTGRTNEVGVHRRARVARVGSAGVILREDFLSRFHVVSVAGRRLDPDELEQL